jgi:hypothetical protein
MFIVVDCGRTGVLGAEVRGARCRSAARVHEPLPRLPERRRALVRLGLSRPIGSILTPMYVGLEEAQDLPAASTLAISAAWCARSRFRCPIFSASFEQAFAQGLRPWYSTWRLRVGRGSAQHLGSHAMSAKVGVRVLKWMGGRAGPIRRLPFAGWTEGRDMPAPEGRTFRELYRERQRRALERGTLIVENAPRRSMNATHEKGSTATKVPARAESLGTENAFVARRGQRAHPGRARKSCRFVLASPISTPPNIQKAAIEAIKAGKHGYTPSAGIDELRAAAAKDIGARRGLEFVPDDVVVGAGAKPFIAYTVASVTDYGAGDEVIYPVPGFPIYESQFSPNGAVPVPIYLRVARLRVRSGRARSEDHAADEAADSQYTAQSDRRNAAGRRSRRDSGNPCAASTDLGIRG